MGKVYFLIKLSFIILAVLVLLSCDEKTTYKIGDVYMYKSVTMSGKESFQVAKVVDIKSDNLFVCVYTDTDIINKADYGNCLDYGMNYLDANMNEDEKNDFNAYARVQKRLPDLPTSRFDPVKFDEFSKRNPTYLKNVEIPNADKKIADDYWKRYPEIK